MHAGRRIGLEEFMFIFSREYFFLIPQMHSVKIISNGFNVINILSYQFLIGLHCFN